MNVMLEMTGLKQCYLSFSELDVASLLCIGPVMIETKEADLM